MTRSTFLSVLICIAIGLTGAAESGAVGPAEVNLRIEGEDQTLFEGPLLTEGHAVRAASDSQWRQCDGTNNSAGSAPAPTPTAAADDAMRMAGENFDGQWHPGFDDYFIQRFGPDGEDPSEFAYWGALINGRFTSTGGCQAQLSDGDGVVWIYDAFSGREVMSLTPAGKIFTPSGPQPTVAQVAPNESIELVVTAYTGGMDGSGQDVRILGGVTVAPVATAANGFQTVEVGSSVAEVSGPEGTVSLEFQEAGWYRFKASAAGFVRSNRVDICVGDCGEPPWDAAVRVPPPPLDPGPGDEPDPSGPSGPGEEPHSPSPSPRGGGGQDGPGPARGTDPRSLVIHGPVLVDGVRRHGRIGVRWRVSDAGARVRRWVIRSRAVGPRPSRWVPRAAGGAGTSSAALRLPAGREHQVIFSVLDGFGRTTTANLGRTIVPLDHRHRRLRYRGAWRSLRDPLAWRNSSRLGARGARLVTALPAGRPVLVLGSMRRGAIIEIRAGRRYGRFRVAPTGRTRRVVIGPRRARPGRVEVRVARGNLALDGVAVLP